MTWGTAKKNMPLRPGQFQMRPASPSLRLPTMPPPSVILLQNIPSTPAPICTEQPQAVTLIWPSLTPGRRATPGGASSGPGPVTKFYVPTASLPPHMTQVSHHHLVNGIHNVQHLVPGDVAVVVQVVELEGPCNQPARTESALARGRGGGPTLHLSMQSSQEPHHSSNQRVSVVV